MGQINIINTVSTYFTVEWFKVVFQHQVDELGSIPCPFPLWSGEHSPDWVEGIE